MVTAGHLPNEHRLPYILYLKAIGLSFAECQSLFQKHFTEEQSDFFKSMSRYIEYYFTKKNYKSWSCSKCINGGFCPFDSLSVKSSNLMLPLSAKSITQKQYGIDLKLEKNATAQASCKSLLRRLIGSEVQIQCAQDIEDHPHLYFQRLRAQNDV